MLEPGAEVLRLPVVGQEYMPGLEGPQRPEIREKLKQYGKAISGNREEALQRLRDFSNDEAEWLSLFQPKLKRKRGEHTSRMTLSRKRIEDTFGAAEQTATYKSKKGADRTQRTLVDKDRAANTSWAKAVFSAFGMAADFSCAPSLPKRRQTQMPVQHDEVSRGGDLAPAEPQQFGSLHEMESFAVRMRRVERNVLSVRDDIYNIEGNINNVTAHLMDLKSLVRNEHCPTLSTPAPSVDHPSPHHNQAPMPVHAAQLEVQVSSLMPSSGQSVSSALRSMPRNPIHSHKLGIALLDGERFEYDKTQVPEPPMIHLSRDIDRLCKEWESSNLLCVGGRGIPVKYWGEFYKRGKGVKNTAWDALRVEWGNWKFIAEERQHYPDTTSFWRAFSDRNGKRFSYQQILNCIADQRISAATQDANDACTFFDGNLDHPLAQGAFRYTKGGKSYVSSKDDAVAKKWRELLATRPDISSRVLAAQSSSQ
ncbi:uncharacterized protein F5891DRAFT_1200534 [Suillus fuscotomentosus]|uniref:SAP domain-containing protein n=1 Tax=Suillus fuscotomentosus TaxID=1912939 RepID=A0AAD4HB59_9AGAM|nr:uncharacterized protein F5891DRAFT_1200534 [Suillus fuscotomentosus]KAG1886885.1 hypothetical protein F5891DRAFT_1200534 [Suillus fuscotomentosus]